VFTSFVKILYISASPWSLSARCMHQEGINTHIHVRLYYYATLIANPLQGKYIYGYIMCFKNSLVVELCLQEWNYISTPFM